MTASTYHVRKVSLGLKRKYRVSDDDGGGHPGEVIAYAEKKLTAADEFTIYADEDRSEQVAVIRESSEGLLASLTGYEVVGSDGDRLGSFGALVTKSIQRTTWRFEQPALGSIIGTERSLATARSRRLISLFGDAPGQIVNAVIKFHFDFADEAGRTMFTIEKPKVLDDWYRITLHDALIEPVLVFALAIAMEALLRG